LTILKTSLILKRAGQKEKEEALLWGPGAYGVYKCRNAKKKKKGGGV